MRENRTYGLMRDGGNPTVLLYLRNKSLESIENTWFYKIKVNLSTRLIPSICVHGNNRGCFFCGKMSLKLGRVSGQNR